MKRQQATYIGYNVFVKVFFLLGFGTHTQGLLLMTPFGVGDEGMRGCLDPARTKTTHQKLHMQAISLVLSIV